MLRARWVTLGDDFRRQRHIRVALVSVTAGGVGLDFSAASNVVFVELPTSVSLVEQAEDRVHRRGQRRPVHVYFLCAHNTTDQAVWRQLGRSLRRVRVATDGEAAAEGLSAHGIPVHEVVVHGGALRPAPDDRLERVEEAMVSSVAPLRIEAAAEAEAAARAEEAAEAAAALAVSRASTPLELGRDLGIADEQLLFMMPSPDKESKESESSAPPSPQPSQLSLSLTQSPRTVSAPAAASGGRRHTAEAEAAEENYKSYLRIVQEEEERRLTDTSDDEQQRRDEGEEGQRRRQGRRDGAREEEERRLTDTSDDEQKRRDEGDEGQRRRQGRRDGAREASAAQQLEVWFEMSRHSHRMHVYRYGFGRMDAAVGKLFVLPAGALASAGFGWAI
jgi:hypothetical protein